MVSKEDANWRDERNFAISERDTRYTLHRVANLILAVCQFAAMICHIICFGVLLSKNNELDSKLGEQPGRETCIFYMSETDNKDSNDHPGIKYNGGHPCDFIAFTAIALAVLAAIMLIFLIVRLIFVNRMNFLGLFDVVEIIIALVMAFVISVTISIGRSVTCNNLADSNRCEIKLYLSNDESLTVTTHSAMKSIETSSWVAVLFLFVVAVVSIGRTVLWVRKLRRERKWNVSAGLVNSEVPSSTYEEVDKTPAAI